MPRYVKVPCEFISGQTLDFSWSSDQIVQVVCFINKGFTPAVIAKELNKEYIEVLILIDDLMKQGSLIKPRFRIYERMIG